MCLIGKTELLCMQCRGIGPHLVARGSLMGFLELRQARGVYSRVTTGMPILNGSLLVKSLKVQQESEKVGLKLSIQKTMIMASGPITSWQIDGETMETVSDFIFWAPKSLQMVTAAMRLKDVYSLEKEMSTHSSILPRKSHGLRTLVGYSPWGRRVQHD